MTVDPFTLAVVHNSLISIAREMKAITMRTAYTQIWKEQGDLSCCLMDSSGDIVAQDPTGFPAHITTMPYQLQGALDVIGRETLVEGDVIITNDPYIGGTHLPDVMIARPIFWEGRMIAFACNRGHWADIGGMGPGSYSAATPEIFQEGLFITPVKLISAGQINQPVMDIILSNVRNRSNAAGDLRAQYASCATGEARMHALLERYGSEVVSSAMEEVLQRSEALTRASIERIPDGVYRASDQLDGDGLSESAVPIELTMTVDGSSIDFDLTRSADQSRGGMNCSHAAAAAGIQYAVKAMTDPENPPNAGSYRPISVRTRPGSVVDAQAPSAMVGFGEVAYKLTDAAFQALGQAMPDRAVGAGSGSTGTVVIGGRRSDNGKSLYFYALELSSGAHGARPGRDGTNAMRYGAGNAGHIPIEADELENPLLFERYEIVADTGGAGRYRGGNAFCRVFRVNADDAKICITADRHATSPTGILGGQSGSVARYVLNPGRDDERALTSKTPYVPLPRGTIVWLQSAGGGGRENPKMRDRDSVISDLRNGYISREEGHRMYGHKD